MTQKIEHEARRRNIAVKEGTHVKTYRGVKYWQTADEQGWVTELKLYDRYLTGWSCLY